MNESNWIDFTSDQLAPHDMDIFISKYKKSATIILA